MKFFTKAALLFSVCASLLMPMAAVSGTVVNPFIVGAPAGGGGLAAWSDITGIVALYDNDVATSFYDATSGGSNVTFNDGGAAEVLRWEDQIGTAHLTQSTTSEAPDYNRTVNSKDAINFWAGADHHFDTPIDFDDTGTYPFATGIVIGWVGLIDAFGSSATPDYIYDSTNGSAGVMLRVEEDGTGAHDGDFCMFDTVEGTVCVADVLGFTAGQVTMIVVVMNSTGVYVYQDCALAGSNEPAGGLNGIVATASNVKLMTDYADNANNDVDGTTLVFFTASDNPTTGEIDEMMDLANDKWGGIGACP